MSITDPLVKRAFDLVIARYQGRLTINEKMTRGEIMADEFLLACDQLRLRTPQSTSLLINIGLYLNPTKTRKEIVDKLIREKKTKDHLSDLSYRKEA